MIKIFVSIAAAIGILFTFNSAHSPVYTPERDKLLIDIITTGFENNHYQQLSLSDEFSAKMYDLYIERLDYGKRFLLKEDIEKLKSYKFKLDDELKSKSLTFFELSQELLTKRTKEAEGMYKEILSKPLTFAEPETLETDPEKIEFAATSKELKDRWRKNLKYQVLSRVVAQLEVQERAIEKKDTVVEQKSFAELEEEMRGKVLKSTDEFFKRMEQTTREEKFSYFMNTFSSIYDPHSGYYPPDDKESFDIQMSGRLEGIGAQLQEKDGYVKVVNIVPGSASWKQGELKEEDVILGVAQGNEDFVDVVDMRLDHVVKLIRGKKGTTVRLQVKKPDGTQKIVAIVRDIVILEETYARSAILEYDKVNGKKIGIIKLPKFYTDFTGTGGRSCAKDVKAELQKLKAEGVDGIILDLRNNGGGSLPDVVEMTGYFIEEGPIVQVKARGAAPALMSDRDPSVVYDGPFVVMVNEFSASASEILAAAIQDYKRGIVLGTHTTHGKGTVQRFIELDQVLQGNDQFKPLGSLKLTTQKFYRIDGRSTQLKGVTPDIVLPDNYQLIEVGEKELDYPLAWDEVGAARYNSWSKPVTNKSMLQMNSSARIQQNEAFRMISENAERLKRQQDKTMVSLELSQYRKETEVAKEEAKKFDDFLKEIPGLTVKSLSADQPVFAADTSQLARIEDWHKNLRKDPYLEEALFTIGEQ